MSTDGLSGKQLYDNEYVKRLVRVKAHQLARMREFRNDSVEDVEQDLWRHLLEQAPKYNPKRAKVETFAARITENQAASLVRDRRAKFRGFEDETLSLEESTKDKDGKDVDFASLLSTNDGLRRLGRHYRPSEMASDRVHDTAWFLSQLPPDYRDLLERRKTSSMKQIAKDLGVSRTTIHARMNEVLKFIEDNRLGDFLRDR